MECTARGDIVNAPTVNCLKGRFDRWSDAAHYSNLSSDLEKPDHLQMLVAIDQQANCL